MKKRFITSLIVLVILALSTASWGLDEIVAKKTYTLKKFTLVSGQTIPVVNIGFETYGTLAPSKDNVILICHYYSGNSHAAGKYSAEDKVPGYWDKIIGPGKPFIRKNFLSSVRILCVT